MTIDHMSLVTDTFSRRCNHCGKVQSTTFEAYRKARDRSHLRVVPAGAGEAVRP